MKYYKFALHKAYFDRGYSITNYIKYIIALFGLSSLNVKLTLFFGFIYAIACYFVGRIWYKKGIMIAEVEVGNQFNKFVKEMRRKI